MMLLDTESGFSGGKNSIQLQESKHALAVQGAGSLHMKRLLWHEWQDFLSHHLFATLPRSNDMVLPPGSPSERFVHPLVPCTVAHPHRRLQPSHPLPLWTSQHLLPLAVPLDRFTGSTMQLCQSSQVPGSGFKDLSPVEDGWFIFLYLLKFIH